MESAGKVKHKSFNTEPTLTVIRHERTDPRNLAVPPDKTENGA